MKFRHRTSSKIVKSIGLPNPKKEAVSNPTNEGFWSDGKNNEGAMARGLRNVGNWIKSWFK